MTPFACLAWWEQLKQASDVIRRHRVRVREHIRQLIADMIKVARHIIATIPGIEMPELVRIVGRKHLHRLVEDIRPPVLFPDLLHCPGYPRFNVEDRADIDHHMVLVFLWECIGTDTDSCCSQAPESVVDNRAMDKRTMRSARYETIRPRAACFV